MTTDTTIRHRQVEVGNLSVHVAEAGDPDAPPILLLHGWPESWRAWQPLMAIASGSARTIAIDLPGVGQSTVATDGSKRALAGVVHDLISTLALDGVTLVGQDVGGMIVYSYLRARDDIRRAVIMDVVLPGVDPWDEVIRNPYIWHFALHAIPGLPERLVQGRQRDYFAFFYDFLSYDPARITEEARNAYVQAYVTDRSLTAGFDWYRAFGRDAAENQQASSGPPAGTPLLYVRGEHETGDIDTYVRGLRAAGVTHVDQGTVPGAGHFTQEEAPEETWRLLAAFAGLVVAE